VTPGGFYAWRRRGRSAHAAQDACLLTEITRHFVAHGGKYGSPRIHRAMALAGWTVSRRRVARLMREAGLRAKAVRGYRAKVGSHRFYAQHPNRLRASRATAPDQISVGDITFLAVTGGWRYLAVVMDQYSRRVRAWTLTRRRDARVTRAVFSAAVTRRRPAAGLIFHSDRGSEYQAAPFGDRVRALGVLHSASSSGPGDNAHMESFFHSLKAELTRGVTFTTDTTLRREIERYMHYYNTTRQRSALGYYSPRAFERVVL
jgi:transposase InsO family protein